MGAGPAELQACVAEDKKQGAISLPKEAAVQVPMAPGKVVGLKEQEPKSWNTANLGRRLGADAMSAGLAGGLVAPVICAIDKYVCALQLQSDIRETNKNAELSSRMHLANAP
jgi:hypothetical protein